MVTNGYVNLLADIGTLRDVRSILGEGLSPGEISEAIKSGLGKIGRRLRMSVPGDDTVVGWEGLWDVWEFFIGTLEKPTISEIGIGSSAGARRRL